MAQQKRSRIVAGAIAVTVLGVTAAVLSAVPADAAGSSPVAATGTVTGIGTGSATTPGSTPGWRSTDPLPAAGADRLSSRLAALATPAVSRLSVGARAAVLGLPASGAGSLVADSRRVAVQVRSAGDVAATAAALRALGATGLRGFAGYGIVTALVPVSSLQALGNESAVRYAHEVLAPLHYGRPAAAPASRPAVVPHPGVCTGAFTSEGDSQLKAAQARSGAGVDGTGVTVGVLSDSYDHATSAPTHAEQDIASGDLPGPSNPCGRLSAVQVAAEYTGLGTDATDEGRAMLQIVHDLAPGAGLSFATAGADNAATQFDFASNITALAGPAGNNPKVMVDDVGYLDEPFFQDGPVAAAITAAKSAGVSYFTAAGNGTVTVKGRDVASWEAPGYRAARCPSYLASISGVTGVTYRDCMNFAGKGVDTARQVTLVKGQSIGIDLQWAQPFGGVSTDLDVFIVDPKGQRFVRSDDNNPAGGEPVEITSLGQGTPSLKRTAVTYDIVIARRTGSQGNPRLKTILFDSDVSAIEMSPGTGGASIFGHSGAASAISVGAVRYTDAGKPEFFSSHGPSTAYFAPYAPGPAAAPLAHPVTVVKPDLAATDGGQNSFFGGTSTGRHRFFGTSAAAPHAAAVAALLLQKAPSLTPDDVLAAMRATAARVGAFPATSVGAGLVDALRAISPPVPPVMTSLTSGPDGLDWKATGVYGAGTRSWTTGVQMTCEATAPPTSVDSALAPAGQPLVSTPLVADTPYECSAVASNPFGIGAPSVGVAVTPGDTTPPTVGWRSTPPPLAWTLLAPAFHWAASDVGGGVTSQALRSRVLSPAGVYGPATTTEIAGAVRDQGVAPPAAGGTVCLEVIVRDAARNSATSVPRCSSVPVDDTGLAASAGSWTRLSASRGRGSFRSTLAVTTRAGATLTLAKATGHTLVLLARTVPGGGRVGLYLGTNRTPTVVWSLASKRVVNQKSFALRLRGAGLRGAKVTIRVIGSGRTVAVDGLVVVP